MPPQSPASLNELRPRERLIAEGPAALSDAELLAIILGTGTAQEPVLDMAQRILSQCGGLHGLAEAQPTDLHTIRGLGPARATQIAAALELGKRLVTTYTTDERPLIRTAADAAHLVRDMAQLNQEHVRLILLDTGQRLLGMPTIYVGTRNASVVRIAELFREAIINDSTALIMVHNHPSGDTDPSPEDIDFTRDLIAVGRLLDIAVIDHLIIGRYGYASLRELGLAFTG